MLDNTMIVYMSCSSGDHYCAGHAPHCWEPLFKRDSRYLKVAHPAGVEHATSWSVVKHYSASVLRCRLSSPKYRHYPPFPAFWYFVFLSIAFAFLTVCSKALSVWAFGRSVHILYQFFKKRVSYSANLCICAICIMAVSSAVETGSRGLETRCIVRIEVVSVAFISLTRLVYWSRSSIHQT